MFGNAIEIDVSLNFFLMVKIIRKRIKNLCQVQMG